MKDMKENRLPELLCPAGSALALEAAIEGGADAVYFGGSLFNARINAKNFTSEDMRASIAKAHAYSVKCYLTLNTLVYDRELNACLEAAREAYEAGIDALIVADLGVAAAIHEYLPDLPLHASTQASGHSVASARELQKLGFSRMVIARETSLDDIKYFCENSDTELEVFVHGALCVCHSGQCLFSSLVGGRSGNRGECAQPCRLPFSVGKKEKYPLSLKDLSLAEHIPELIDAGVASLKIEGRMKSPEYVLAVTRVFRRLLDERRGATPEEMAFLESVFSRGGFTDGYFVKKINSSMLGVRSESDKKSTRELEAFTGISRKIPIKMTGEFQLGKPATLTVKNGDISVTVTGDAPEAAQNRPMDVQDLKKNLSKLGGTPYELELLELSVGEGIMVPLSKLNALRREAVAALMPKDERKAGEVSLPVLAPKKAKKAQKTARFLSPEQLSDKAKSYFDIIYLPLERYGGQTNGVIMPPVVFDSERGRVRASLERAAELGARHVLVGNLGHLSLCDGLPLTVHGDFRLNATNSAAAAALEGFGFADFIASPELTLPQLRDLGGEHSAVVYGKIPLMLLEKCVVCELSPCKDKGNSQKLCAASLTDRRGVSFPVFREGDHRNVIYNSLPTSMSDRQDQLKKNGINSYHFIFSDENSERVLQVIRAFEKSASLGDKVRRI